MHVINYIKENGLNALTSLHINIRDYNDRVVLNYNQIDGIRFHPISDECRALILRKGSWEVLSRSFDRFYNYNELPDKFTDKFIYDPKLKVLEKIDGSLISIYHDGVAWRCGSRSMAFAEGLTPLGNSLHNVVERIIGKINDRFHEEDQNNMYTFELIASEMRVITSYPKDDLVLLTIRERKTEREWLFKDVESWGIQHGFRVPRNYSFNSWEDIIQSLKSLPPLEEGYVALLELSDHIWRVKIKNPAYLAIAHLHMCGYISEKKIITLIFLGNDIEYLSYFPNDASAFKPYQDAYAKMIKSIRHHWNSYGGLENKKEFAMKVKDLPTSSILFSMKKGISLEESLNRLHDDIKVTILQRFYTTFL